MRASHSSFGAKSVTNSGATVATAPAPRPHSSARGTQPPKAEVCVAAPRPKVNAIKPPKKTGGQEIFSPPLFLAAGRPAVPPRRHIPCGRGIFFFGDRPFVGFRIQGRGLASVAAGFPGQRTGNPAGPNSVVRRPGKELTQRI